MILELDGRSLRRVGAVLAVTLGLALAARYGVMESDKLALACADGSGGFRCVLRSWLPQLFIHERLGWASLAAGLLAFGAGVKPAAWAGLVWGGTGLVLYAYDYSAVGALLSLLVLVRPQRRLAPGGGGEAETGYQP